MVGSFLIEFTIDLSIAKIRSAQERENKETPSKLSGANVYPATNEVNAANKHVTRIIKPIFAWRLYSLGHFSRTEISEPEMSQKKYCSLEYFILIFVFFLLN